MPLCLVWVAGNNTPFPVARLRGRVERIPDARDPRGKRKLRLARVGANGNALLESGIRWNWAASLKGAKLVVKISFLVVIWSVRIIR